MVDVISKKNKITIDWIFWNNKKKKKEQAE